MVGSAVHAVTLGSVGCPQFMESTECTQSVGMVEGTEMAVASVCRQQLVMAE